jgi:GT2 family glycosyltransferase
MSRISVVIPTYNRRELVRRAIESALGQTLPPEEVVVVDDNSADGTPQMLRSWQATEPRLRPVCNPVNQGPAGARNLGVATARCDLVAFLDSDDVWGPGHLEACARLLEARPHLDLVFADLCRLRHDGTVLHPRYLTDHKRINQYLVADTGSPDWFTFRGPESQVLLRDYLVPVQTSVARRGAALSIPFDVNILGPEDYDFALRMARAGKRFGYVNRVHCQCFIHDGNLLSNGNAAIRESREVRKVWVKLLSDPTLRPSERHVVRDRIAQLFFDEGYAHRCSGDRMAAVRAHFSGVRARFSWRALKGLVAAAFFPSCPR